MTAPSASGESLTSRLLVLLGIATTTAIAIALTKTNASRQTSTGAFYDFVVNHRASTQLIVQILSHLLGAVLVLTLTSLLNFRTRLYLGYNNSVSLNTLTWWNQLCSHRLNWELPWTFGLGLLLFYAITLIPAALWAGAITPVVTREQAFGVTNIPKYTLDPQGRQLNQTTGNWEGGAANTTINDYGQFSFFPAYPFGGRILNKASSATSLDNKTTAIYEKFDNSQYSFNGRSHGIGATVGWPLLNETRQIIERQDISILKNLAEYSFEQVGYDARVSCMMNHSSQWNLLVLYESGYSGIPIILFAIGPLPNSPAGDNTFQRGMIDVAYSAEPIVLAQFAYVSDISMAAIGAVSNDGTNYLALTSYGGSLGATSDLPSIPRYSFLNHVQCEVKFIPRTFRVDADTNQRLINVTDIGTADESLIDPTVSDGTFPTGQGVLAQMVMRQTMVLSASLSTLFYSAVGDAFANNVQNLYTRLGVPLDSFSNVTLNLRGIESTFESILDDMLLGMSSAQVMLTNGEGIATAPVTATVNAVAIGQSGYIYAIAAFNFLVLILCLFEAITTRGWSQLTNFDYNNLGKLIVATSIGGRAIGSNAVNRPSTAHAAHVRVSSTATGMTALCAANVAADSNRGSNQDLHMGGTSYQLHEWQAESSEYKPVSQIKRKPVSGIWNRDVADYGPVSSMEAGDEISGVHHRQSRPGWGRLNSDYQPLALSQLSPLDSR